MGKSKKNKGQFPKSNKSQKAISNKDTLIISAAAPSSTRTVSDSILSVQPEHMSLTAHAHITAYMVKQDSASSLSSNDVTAVLKLAQHLRVFGLLSAAGFVKQANQQEGEVKDRLRPVWESLLCQLLNIAEVGDADALMAAVVEMTGQRPSEYMALWRRAIAISKHWNFWARAYQQESTSEVTP